MKTHARFLKTSGLLILPVLLVFITQVGSIYYGHSITKYSDPVTSDSIVSGMSPSITIHNTIAQQPKNNLIEHNGDKTLPILLSTFISAIVLTLLIAWYLNRPYRQLLEQQRAFVANASHEIKTPISLMRSEVELLAEQTQVSATQIQTFSEYMLSDLDRLSRLANRLLRLARIDSGTIIETKSISLKRADEYLERFVNRFANTYTTHHISYTSRYTDNFVRIAPEDVIQILEIVLENACTHTPDRTTVTVSLKTRVNQCIISIVDNGPGIASEHLPHVTKRFYRAGKNTMEAKAKSTGLGLSIAKELTEAQGGIFFIENNIGRGLVVTLQFPLI